MANPQDTSRQVINEIDFKSPIKTFSQVFSRISNRLRLYSANSNFAFRSAVELPPTKTLKSPASAENFISSP